MTTFPKFNPQRKNRHLFEDASHGVQFSDYDKVYRALRHSSSAFKKRADVRNIIFSKSEKKCFFCQTSDKQLCITHHPISVYSAARNTKLIALLNTEGNLKCSCIDCALEGK